MAIIDKVASSVIHRKIYQATFIFMLLVMSSCAKKAETTTDIDFTDKVISLAVSERSNLLIEMPELYNRPVTAIPDDKDQSLIMAEKLKLRGFKLVDTQHRSLQLNGMRYYIETLTKDDCQCSVLKTFYSTGNISQYRVSESISCKNIQP